MATESDYMMSNWVTKFKPMEPDGDYELTEYREFNKPIEYEYHTKSSPKYIRIKTT